MNNCPVLSKPLTTAEIHRQRKIDGNVRGVVAVHVADFLVRTQDDTLDLLSQLLTGTDLLIRVQYQIVGGKGNTLHVLVSGDPCDIVLGAQDALSFVVQEPQSRCWSSWS